MDFFRVLQVLLLGLSFGFLLQFAIRLLEPLPERLRPLRYLPSTLLLLWALGPVFLGLTWSPSLASWHPQASALARYLLGLPGGLLSAYALRAHARRNIAPLEAPQVVRSLRVAGIATAGYALVGGLVVPRVPFFPGNVLNEALLAELGFPAPIFRSILGLVLLVAMVRSLEVFDMEVERRLEAMEQANILALERERIRRELHDRTLQQLYAAGLLAQAIKEEKGLPPAASQLLDDMLLILDRATEDMRLLLSTSHLLSGPSTLGELVREVVKDPRFAAALEVGTHIEVPDLRVDAETAGQVAAILSEALSNVVRHSRAKQAWVEALAGEGRIVVQVRDDGNGIPPGTGPGVGLRSMRERARLLGGDLEIESAPGQGTTVRLLLPRPREEG